MRDTKDALLSFAPSLYLLPPLQGLQGPPIPADPTLATPLFSTEAKGPDDPQMCSWETRRSPLTVPWRWHPGRGQDSRGLSDFPLEGLWVGGANHGNLENRNLYESTLSAHM